jgi:AcrR family transcriptional regulator
MCSQILAPGSIGCTNKCNEIFVTRTYTLRKRAEQQAATRQRIVEAAVDLHSTVGPSATTVSMVAERAGVQRHTYYAHFPDERSLAMACSGLALERDPVPDPAPWRAIADPAQRLRVGLSALYDWQARNAQLNACVMRDLEHNAVVREICELRYGPPMGAIVAVLGAGMNARQHALLHLAMSYYTWRTLVRDSGLSRDDAVDAMVHAVMSAGEHDSPALMELQPEAPIS